MTTLRIGLVYDDTMDRYGGVGQYCLALGCELQSLGHDVRLLVGQTKANNIRGIPVTSLSRNLSVKFNGNALSIPINARDADIANALGFELDVLHVQMPYSPLMAGKLISRASETTAVIGTFHVASDRLFARSGARVLAHWCRPTLARFDAVVSVSDPADEFARHCFGLVPDSQIPNMTPVVERPVVLPDNTTPTVAFVGRLEERKGVRQLIREFARVVEQVPDAHLLIAGDGSQRELLKRLTQRLGLASQVAFLGAIDSPARALLLASADVACFPSTYGESFGIVLIEAMSAGSGVAIGGQNPGHKFVLENDPDTIADANTTGDIASKIVRLLDDPTLRLTKHEAQHKLVQRYKSSQVASDVLTLYEGALERRRHPTPTRARVFR